MGRGSARIYNLVSLIAVLLTGLVIISLVVILAGPPPAPQVVELPTTFPTFTPTLTFTPSTTPLPPTWTPSHTPTLSPTPTATNTAPPLPTSTITNTPGPTDTPSLTPTPSVSPTQTPSRTPTGPSPTWTPSLSPYPYTLRDAVTFYDNTTFQNGNTAGCQWQGVGGQVIDLNGNQIGSGSLQVRVFNSEIERVVAVGSNSFYGQQSGWEHALDNQVNAKLFFVQLETIQGTIISPRAEVQFPGDCTQNVAILTFIQAR